MPFENCAENFLVDPNLYYLHYQLDYLHALVFSFTSLGGAGEADSSREAGHLPSKRVFNSTFGESLERQLEKESSNHSLFTSN